MRGSRMCGTVKALGSLDWRLFRGDMGTCGKHNGRGQRKGEAELSGLIIYQKTRGDEKKKRGEKHVTNKRGFAAATQ